jgi:tetratricopeptide (TPR) repeat protein
MALSGRSVRKFTKAESFQLFMEGLRSLQSYDEEADKDQPSDEDILNERLCKAEEFFRKCFDNYPRDILPRYYLGLVLSIRGQIEQARQLRSELKGKDPKTIPNDPDALFLQAAKIFEQIADEVGRGDLLAYAQYNQAQALAKTGPLRS